MASLIDAPPLSCPAHADAADTAAPAEATVKPVRKLLRLSFFGWSDMRTCVLYCCGLCGRAGVDK